LGIDAALAGEHPVGSGEALSELNGLGDIAVSIPTPPSLVAEPRRPSSASTMASTVPSPPSAIGTPVHSASETADMTPLRIARAAGAAIIDSLNESGARTNFFMVATGTSRS
jgi:hypothetical protein